MGVGALVACLFALTTPARAAQASSQPPAGTAVKAVAAGSTGSTAKLRLTASRSKVSPGSRVRFTVTNGTKVRRVVHIQRWNPKKRAWRTVAKRTVHSTNHLTLSVPKGTWRYRAVAPRTKVRQDARAKRAKRVGAARSRVVSVKAIALARMTPPIPAPTTAPPAAPTPATESTPTLAPTPGTPLPTPTTSPTSVPTTTAPTTPTSAPTPTPTPAPTTAPVPTERPQEAGAAPLGSAHYPVPARALYVAPKGTRTGSGTASDPYGSIVHAISRATSGDTLVLRGGSYHESVAIPTNKRVTIQNHPGEVVWLDGSSVVSGFTKSGSTWVKSGWTATFDNSPTYAKGAPDGTAAGWQWINPRYPMASHPDQVWINGRKLTQVRTRAEVVAGTFFVDHPASQLVIGSDPAGAEVRASDLELGLTIVAADSVVRGIGVRRYATPVPEMGTVRVAADRVTLENVIVTENATQGVTGWAANTTLRRVSSIRNGLTGFHANRSNGYVADRILAEGNNAEHFNVTPVSAGLKISNSRGITVTDSVFHANDGTGLWFDVSDTDVVATGNTITNNTDDGLIFELSSRLLAVNNTIRGNASQSVFVIDSGDVRLWNNTITGSLVPVRVADTDRLNSDPSVPWRTENIDIRNNVISGMVKGDNWCGMLCVYDHQKKRTAEQMRVTIDGNVYQRADRASPDALIRWAAGTAGPKNHATLTAFRTATGQERSGAEILGAIPATLPKAGTALPGDVATWLGVSAGAIAVGARS